MDNLNISILTDKFEAYYANAKKAQQENNVALAKRNYMLAAETMLKLAKISSPELKKARIERAKRLIDIAENLEAEMENSKDRRTSPAQSQTSKNDDEGKQWAAAEIPNIHFSDIAGLEDVKKAITTRMINPLKYPEKYAAYGKKTGGGVLLYGPPGTGKTMIAKAIACEVGATFFAIKGSDIVSKWVGDSEKNINSLFETARKEKLAIIFIDEMDSLIGKRGEDIHNDKRVNEFLQQIDGFVGRNPNLLLLGATNRPWDIDGAAMRSGRFSQKIYVPLPDGEARRFLLNKFLKNAPLDDSVSIDELVRISDGYSGADIEEICDRAKEDPLLKAIQSDSIVKITRNDLINAFRQVRPSVSKREIVEFERYAGIDPSAAAKAPDVPTAPVNPAPAEKPQAPDKKEDIVIEFASDVIKLQPCEKPQVEFFVDRKFSMVSVKINGKNYACSGNIRNWKSEKLDIAAGKYTVEIFGDSHKIGEKELTFVQGIEENDFGI